MIDIWLNEVGVDFHRACNDFDSFVAANKFIYQLSSINYSLSFIISHLSSSPANTSSIFRCVLASQSSGKNFFLSVVVR